MDEDGGAGHFLQFAPRDDQGVARLDQVGAREVAPRGGFLDVGDGALAPPVAALRDVDVLLVGRQPVFGQRHVLARQQGLQVAADQAGGGIARLGVEERQAVVGAGIALAHAGDLGPVEQGLVELDLVGARHVVQVDAGHAAAAVRGFQGAGVLVAPDAGADLRQQGCAAQGTVGLAGLALADRRLVGGIVRLGELPGGVQPQGGGWRGWRG
nr:hypothetical protein [Castellaniella defragrans]